MGFTEFGTASPQTRKVWSEQLFRESLGKMSIRSLISSKRGACIQLLTELDKGAGDTVYYDLLAQDRSAGVNGDTRLKGFEAPLTYHQDTLKINQKRHAHSFKGMSQQRTLHDLREDGRFSLSAWKGWFFEAGIFTHLAGVVGDGNEALINAALGVAAVGDADFAGNTVTALDSAHVVDGTAGAMETDLITDAVAKAQVSNPRMAPLMIDGQEKFVLYMHPYAVRKMKQDTAASGWNLVQQNAAPRGSKNPIYTGALGEYDGVILRSSEFVPRVGNVSHNVLLGQGAGAIAFGNAWKRRGRAAAGGGSFFEYREDDDDYGNEEGVAAVSCPGFKRATFNSAAFGVIGIRSTDAAPS